MSRRFPRVALGAGMGLSAAVLATWVYSSGECHLWATNPSGLVVGVVDGSIWLAHENRGWANSTAHYLGRMADRELAEQGETYSAAFAWHPDVRPASGHWLFVAVPLWAIMIVGWVPFASCVIRSTGRHSRRTVHPTCHCGYNLTGNVSGRCPECGTEVAPVAVRTAKG